MKENNAVPNKADGKNNDHKPVEAEEQVALSKKEYEDLKAKCAERDSLNDRYLRTHAEFENARRRMEKEKADFIKFANESFILGFLPILDNLEMAERHIKEAKDFKAVRDGVDMIQQQIQKFTKDLGVERIKTVGEKFDPHLHEAMETVESNDKDEGFIIEEMKPGYKLNGKLLRPAMVKIVKKEEEKKGES